MTAKALHQPANKEAMEARAGVQVRRIATEILVRVEVERAFADALLGHRSGELTQSADRGLLTQVVLGTIAWQGRIDYELKRISSRPLEQLDPRIRAILRMGLYQIRMLTRVPSHAVVDTAVHLAKEQRRDTGTAGFVNAILRNAIRRPVALPERSRDENEYLSVAHSHPRWLVEALIRWYGVSGAEAIMAANNGAAPNAVRLNLTRGGAEKLIERLRRDQIRIERRGVIAETAFVEGPLDLKAPSYREGLFTPQSEVSQLIAHMLSPTRGAMVIDCAAAPGGKSTHLAEMVGSAGQVIAIDRNRTGLRKIRALADRLGHRNITLVQCDLAGSIALRTRADYVLLDAPCTGLGTLREHPEIRWRVGPEDPVRMGQLQRALLENAAAMVRRGGIVVYSVCSIAPEEGPEVVRGFLGSHPEYCVERVSAGPLAELIDEEGFLRTRPDRESRDGFFAARLNRRS
jgi:16S rRNA (cytosine967-C5)-methyltransferase